MFAGWENCREEVTEDVIITAKFGKIVNRYTITFENEDGKILQVRELENSKDKKGRRNKRSKRNKKYKWFVVAEEVNKNMK